MAAYGNFIPSQFQIPQEKSSLEAAAEAAAKVNAMLIAKGKLRPNQVHNNQQNQKKVNPNNMVAAEVEINDAPLSMRNMLTRGPTQEEITKFSGAAVSTRGRYMTPVEKMKNNSGERPLYLFVQGPNQDSVNVAVARINEILTGGKGGAPTGGGLVRTSAAPPPTGQHQLNIPPAQPPPQGVGPPMMHMHTMQMPPVHQPPPMMAPPVQPPEMQQITVLEEKLFIGLEHAPPNFDVKGKLLGPGGSYLMHIQTETCAKVFLRGKGSGFFEPALGREAFEPMHILIQHPNMMGLQQAKQLAENLIQTVQQMYASFQQVLASLPPAVAPGPTAYITGNYQQPTSMAEAAFLGPPPGMPTLTGLPEAQLVQSAQGLQQQQTVMVPSSSISSVMMPAGSIASTLSAMNQGQPGAAGMMMPTTLSMTHVPVVSTLPISTQTHLHLSAPPGALELGQQQLMMSQAPPPQPLGQVNLAPQMTVQTSMPASMASLASLAPAPTFNPGLQQTMQLVSQPGPGMAPPPAPVPGPGQPSHYQTIYTPELVSSGHLVISSAPSSHIYSMATSNSMVTNTPTTDSEFTRRRFTEEKDDKIPESLLGYQHGPPHLVNLVCSSPPPMGQGQPSQSALMQGQAQGQPAPQPGFSQAHPQMSPAPQPQQVAVMQGQPQPGQLVQQTHPGLQAALPPGHPGIPTSFTLQPGIQVQTIHTLSTQLPPNSMSPVSQAYQMPPTSMEENRFGVPTMSSAPGMMPPPPPPTSVSIPSASNGEQVGGTRQLMPPPSSRSDSQPWGAPANGPKRGMSNGDRGPEQDRKRRKGENGAEEEENGSQSPRVQSESPKPGTPTQGHAPRSQAYSPGRDAPLHDSFDHVPLPPPPPPHHQQPAYQPQQFESGGGVPPGAHLTHMPQASQPYDLAPQPPPPPMHQHFVDAGGQPPPPPLQFQDLGPQFVPPSSQGEMAQFHPQPHSQAELGHPYPTPPGHPGAHPQGDMGHNPYVPVSAQGEMGPGGGNQPAHSLYSQFSQAFSQPGPQQHYITTPPVSSHSSFHPGQAPQLMHQHAQGPPRHPHGPPPPPPPPPPSSQYQHGPPQGYWHS
ncbi:uncharacterized protein [Littorina saxatilis]|uniref:KH homology domain-containing protein 4 n=1 Tax=Littorina saxatilis TaxID=31220 RepID=A0AAN9C1Q2_9CAEN